MKVKKNRRRMGDKKTGKQKQVQQTIENKREHCFVFKLRHSKATFATSIIIQLAAEMVDNTPNT